MAARLLRQEFPRAEVDEVYDQAGFERTLHRGGYAAVVTDYQMRWTDGIAVLKAAKSRWPDCPVVLFTSSGSEEVAVEAMKAGADDYVIKNTRHMVRLPHAVRHAIERETARRRLAEVEAHLQGLTDALDVGVFRATPEGRLLTCNPAFLRIVGQATLDEARAVRLNGLLRPADRTPAVRDGQDGRVMAPREHQVRRPDGSTVWVRVSERLANEGGQPVIDGLVEDVTARKALEDALRARTEALEENDRRKDEFLAMLAHELRNPLSPILSAAQVLSHRTAAQNDPRVRDACALIDRQVHALSRLVDDLLDVSRVNLGKIVLHREPGDLRRAVERAVEVVAPLLEHRGHHLSVNLPAHPIPVLLDLTRMTQVFANLLSNAAKFTPDGGHLAISLYQEADAAVARVTDDGAGISPSLIPSIFELFIQGPLPLDRAQGGLGVGLTLVRRLVELHGGTVVARSDGVDLGSEFTVRLPLGPSPEPAAAPGREPDGCVGDECKRVLVVDDNHDSADSLVELLQLFGHDARTAYDGPEALRVAAEFHPDVVFLDLGLPGMDGYEVARILRRQPGPQPLLVALSGYGHESDKARSREAGFDHHMVKPADLDAMQRLLKGRRQG